MSSPCTVNLMNKLSTEELIEFIKTEHARLMKFYNLQDKKELKHLISLKIMEELGELCEEILAQEKIQRTEKLQNKDAKIDDEIADVLITTLLLAENMDVDVLNALKNGLEKRKNRTY